MPLLHLSQNQYALHLKDTHPQAAPARPSVRKQKHCYKENSASPAYTAYRKRSYMGLALSVVGGLFYNLPLFCRGLHIVSRVSLSASPRFALLRLLLPYICHLRMRRRSTLKKSCRLPVFQRVLFPLLVALLCGISAKKCSFLPLLLPFVFFPCSASIFLRLYRLKRLPV